MTPAPVVVEENTNLEDAAKLLSLLIYSVPSFIFFYLTFFFLFRFATRILLETKYRRLPVVDSDGKLVRERFNIYGLPISHT